MCSFCKGKSTKENAYYKIWRNFDEPLGITFFIQWQGCPSYADCAANCHQRPRGSMIMGADFRYCPYCGEKLPTN